MKAILSIATTTHRVVEIADKCPHCAADLTQEKSLQEERVCTTLATSHLGTEVAEGQICQLETDSEDDGADCIGTETLRCMECQKVIADVNTPGTSME